VCLVSGERVRTVGTFEDLAGKGQHDTPNQAPYGGIVVDDQEFQGYLGLPLRELYPEKRGREIEAATDFAYVAARISST